MSVERLGIIDLGSNSSRLVIYQIHENGAYQPIFEMKRNIRLAQCVSSDGRITQEGIRRAVTCTMLFYRAGVMHEVTRWFAVATAAIRQAANREEIVQLLQEQTGVAFRVLSGEEEGRYGYLGVVNTVEVQNALLFDIGGASTEIMRMQDRNLLSVTSLPFGAVNLTEKFRHLQRDQLGAEVGRFMREQFANVPWLQGLRGVTLIGMGGTARALAKIDRAHNEQKGGRIHGYEVSRATLGTLTDKIVAATPEQIRKINGVSAARADLLPAGLSIIDVLSETVNASMIIISKNAVREGIFFEYLLRYKQDPRVSSVLLHSVENFQKLFQVNRRLAMMVTDVALQLFDVLQRVHGCGLLERKLLQVTAQIENSGTYINTDKWAKHSAYLAISSHLYGLTQQELQQVSQMLIGKGDAKLKKLLLLIRLAKLLVLQVGIEPEQLECRLKKGVLSVGRARNMREIVRQSTEMDLERQLAKAFQVTIEYIEQ